MSTVSMAICGIVIVIETIFVPLYLKKMWPIKNNISLCYKMICATGYLLVGFTAAFQLGEFNRYAMLMLTAFACSWLGDLFLHIPKPQKIFFIIGMFFFMAAHVFFCLSYFAAQRQISADIPIFTGAQIGIALALVTVFFGISHIKGVRFGIIMIPGIFYALFVTMMMIKSTALGITLLCADSSLYLVPAILLFAGGSCFVMSDTTLALIMFDTRFKKFKLKVFNIITYFAAQLCLAMTLFFVN